MPRDNDKDNDSRGRRDRPAAAARRQGPFRRRAGAGEEIRQARLCRQGRRRQARWRAASLCRQVRRCPVVRQEALCGGASPTPASATAIVRRAAISTRRARRVATGRSAIAARAAIVRRASTAMTVLVAIGRSPAVRPAVTTVRSVRSSRARTVAARSARTRRAVIVRTSIATTVRRAGTARAALGARPAARCPTGRTLRREEIRREAALYAAWRRLAAATDSVPSARRRGWRPALAAIGRSGNSAATRNFLAWRARSWPAQGFWRRRRSRRFKAVAEARGSRRPRFAPAARRRAQFRQAALRPPRDDRGGEERPRFSRSREDRPAARSRRSSTVREVRSPRRAPRRPHRLAGASAQRAG